MSPDGSFVAFVLDQLADLGVTARAMFGGHGLYLGERFFGIVYEDRLFLKTDEATRGWYEERGMQAFRPTAKQHLKSYYEVPPDALDDPEQLLELADEAAARPET
ncbi:MAG TPA: TfoX/Sxy family protein [Actinomycetota bacterium]|nr:TfoX/Sxy family protein [Actinomycetota bacterium]